MFSPLCCALSRNEKRREDLKDHLHLENRVCNTCLFPFTEPQVFANQTTMRTPLDLHTDQFVGSNCFYTQTRVSLGHGSTWFLSSRFAPRFCLVASLQESPNRLNHSLCVPFPISSGVLFWIKCAALQGTWAVSEAKDW